MRKLVLLSIALLTVFASHASIKIETCIEEHIPYTNCFKVQVSIINDDPEHGRVLVAQGSTWVGSDCAKNGHHEIPGSNPDCPPVVIGNGIEIYTTSGQHCMAGAITDEEMSAAVLASITDLLITPATAGKGAKATNIPPVPLRIYPNPATSFITVATHYEGASAGTMHILDATGKEVSITQIQNPSGARFTLMLSDIAPGNYNIIIKSKGVILGSQKITKQ